MKKTKRIIGLLLTLALIVSMVPMAFVFGNSLGESLFESSMDIGEKITLAKGVYWNSSYKEKITESYIEYTPGKSVKPIISHGNDIYGAAGFKTVAAMAEAEGQHVVAGLNGDFFDMTTGVPLGVTIKNKLLLNSGSATRPVLGFYSDGSLIIGRPNVKISASGASISSGFTALNYNKVLTDATGVVLYTRVFADDFTNKAKIPSYNVLLQVDRDEFGINDYIQGTVVQAQESTGATAIPAGHILLSISLSTQYTGSLGRLVAARAGDIINFTFEADPLWDDVEYAIGGGAMLVEKGELVTPADKEIHPRTAVGIKADGTAVFYTVDGRQTDHSKGLSLAELSQRMIELGCVEAINMDGGGSTAIHGIYPGDENLSLINRPSQTALRNCANYILLINTAKPVGGVSRLHIYPYEARILAGSEIGFQVKASDDNYYPVNAPAQLTFSYTGSVGSINKADKDYLFTAAKTKSKGSVTASSAKAGGKTNVEIVDKPDIISIFDEGTGKSVSGVNLFAGEKVNLKAEATYKGMPILSSDKAYSWTVSGDVGTIDEEGVFTAAEINKGSGQITATVNGITVSINVSILSEGWLLESFEGKDNFFRASETAGTKVSINKDLTKVKYGYQSALLEYDFDLVQAGEGQENSANSTNSDRISFPVKTNFTKAPKMIGFYLYGDGSGNDIELTVNASGGKQTLKAANMDFQGWKLVTVSLPAGTSSLEGINIFKAGKSKGSIYLDQFVAGIGFFVDTQAPEITMEVKDGWLTATIKDETDASISLSNIKLTLDGQARDFQFNITNGILQKELPVNDGDLHRLAIEASDETGNIARMSMGFKGDFPGEEGAGGQEDIFIDTKGHWAKDNIEYLYRMGIVNGSGPLGELKFNPNKSITRAEFAVLMTNWTGEKAAAYIGTDLPFIDAPTIPNWATESVQAMYGMGIIAGTGTDKGVVFNPTGSISRQEVMTIIGRTQARGYGEASLTSFTDNKNVADWAFPYVSSLVKQGVISGSGGKLNPKNPVTRAEVATIITGLN